MSETEELPSWASRAVPPGSVGPTNVPEPPPVAPPPRRRWPLVLLGLLVLAVIGGGAYVLSNRGDDSSVASGNPAGPATSETLGATTATAAGGQVAGGASSTTQAVTTTTAPATTASSRPGTTANAPASGSPAKGTVTADNPEGAIRYAVFKGGQVHLRGLVPAEAVGKEIETRAGKVLGPPNVFNEYQIDPTVPIETPAPVYVEDVVLFGFNSVTLDPAFTPILDLGTKLLTLIPTAKIKVVATTDSVGSADANLRVSQQRAQAVIDYWVRKGIDAGRLTPDPRGETGSTPTDDPQTAALHRRAEFIITGFLG